MEGRGFTLSQLMSGEVSQCYVRRDTALRLRVGGLGLRAPGSAVVFFFFFFLGGGGGRSPMPRPCGVSLAPWRRTPGPAGIGQ